MSQQVKDAARDLGLYVTVAVLSVLLPVASSRGVSHMTVHDLRNLADTAGAAGVVFLVQLLTPASRKYGLFTASSKPASDLAEWSTAGVVATPTVTVDEPPATAP